MAQSRADGVLLLVAVSLCCLSTTLPRRTVATDTGKTLVTVVTKPAGMLNVTAELSYTSLHNKVSCSSYYVSAKAIAIGKAQVQLPWHALANGGVVFRQFSTRVRYTTLRPDVFHKASGWEEFRVPAVPPFELCYDSNRLPSTQYGPITPDIDLTFWDGENYTLGNVESLVQLQDDPQATCFEFVEMKAQNKGGHYGAAPAVEITRFQMQENLILFDL